MDNEMGRKGGSCDGTRQPAGGHRRRRPSTVESEAEAYPTVAKSGHAHDVGVTRSAHWPISAAAPGRGALGRHSTVRWEMRTTSSSRRFAVISAIAASLVLAACGGDDGDGDGDGEEGGGAAPSSSAPRQTRSSWTAPCSAMSRPGRPTRSSRAWSAPRRAAPRSCRRSPDRGRPARTAWSGRSNSARA